MSARKKCQRDGHKFRDLSTMHLPYVYCARWFCTVSAVASWAPPETVRALHNAIPKEDRYPPEEM